MASITKRLTFHLRRTANFIVLEGENREFYWFALIEMGFTRARRYANHNSGRKYKKGTREILPQEEDHMTSKYAESARIFKHVRDIVAKSEDYVRMRKQWRASE